MLVIGYGNPGRMDDGLGPAFAERIETADLPGVDVSQDYQLTVEHALALRGTDRVVFADALIGSRKPFEFSVLEPSGQGDLTSHSMSPANLLALAATLFGAAPEAHVLGISGVSFGEVQEGLSDEATKNLEDAVAFFIEWVSGRVAAPAVVDWRHA